MSTSPRLAIFANQDRSVARTAGEEYVAAAFTAAMISGKLRGWTIYEQPHLNGDRPDFVLMNPEWGVILIEVKDWNIEDKFHWHPGCMFHDPATGMHQKVNPVEQVERYRKNILELYSRKFLAVLELEPTSGWAIIERAVYFHHASSARAVEVCGSHKYVRFLERSNMDAIARGDIARSGSSLLRRSDMPGPGNEDGHGRDLLAEFVHDLEPWMRQTDNRVDLSPIELTPEQARNAEPTLGSRRLRGAAGAGKSVVLATRAAKSLGKRRRVLLLTFNITLQHYLRDLVNLQYTGEVPGATKSHLVIRHFHGFLRWVAGEHGIVLPAPSESGHDVDRVLNHVWPQRISDWLDQHRNRLKPDFAFDTILIDEGQDFTREWVTLAMRFFREPANELLIAFDGAQNIYGRELTTWLDAGGDVAGLGFRGPPAELRQTKRLPSAMTSLAQAFGARYMNPGPTAVEQDTQPELFAHGLAWLNESGAEVGAIRDGVLRLMNQIIKTTGAHPNDIAILVEDHDVALPIVEALVEGGHNVAHVFDLTGNREYRTRHDNKWRFQPTSGTIKVSTLHSFKGWEAPYVIAVFGNAGPARSVNRNTQAPDANRASLIYLAMTRLKRSSGGYSSVFAAINLDPDFDGVIELFEEAVRSQSGLQFIGRSAKVLGVSAVQ